MALYCSAYELVQRDDRILNGIAGESWATLSFIGLVAEMAVSEGFVGKRLYSLDHMEFVRWRRACTCEILDGEHHLSQDGDLGCFLLADSDSRDSTLCKAISMSSFTELGNHLLTHAIAFPIAIPAGIHTGVQKKDPIGVNVTATIQGMENQDLTRQQNKED